MPGGVAHHSHEGRPGPDEAPWILFVDDDPLLLRSLQRTVYRQFKLQTASSGMEALELLATSSTPAVAVIDQEMPEMPGIELLCRLRAISPDTVRVMLTGKADLALAIQAVNQGQVFRFLTKPVDVPMLNGVLTEAVRVFVQKTDENRLLAEAMAELDFEGSEVEAASLLRHLRVKLTERELEVLKCLAQGGTSKELGPRLGISPRTVDVHRSHLLEKLGCHHATSLIHIAIKAGLV